MMRLFEFSCNIFIPWLYTGISPRYTPWINNYFLQAFPGSLDRVLKCAGEHNRKGSREAFGHQEAADK